MWRNEGKSNKKCEKMGMLLAYVQKVVSVSYGHPEVLYLKMQVVFLIKLCPQELDHFSN